MERIDFIAAHRKMSLFLERFKASHTEPDLWQRARFRYAVMALNNNYFTLAANEISLADTPESERTDSFGVAEIEELKQLDLIYFEKQLEKAAEAHGISKVQKLQD